MSRTFDEWWSSSNYDLISKSVASEAWYSRDAEVAELKERVEYLLINLDAKHACLQDAHKKNDALQAKLTELERLNKVALEAMKYHTEQTRPIERTNNAIKEIEGSKP